MYETMQSRYFYRCNQILNKTIYILKLSNIHIAEEKIEQNNSTTNFSAQSIKSIRLIVYYRYLFW